MPTSTREDARWWPARRAPRAVPDVNSPKSFSSVARSCRSMRRATVASSTARSNCSGVSERTRRMSDGRAPNSLRNWPIGITTNSSCDCPNMARVGSLTPTTRKFTP